MHQHPVSLLLLILNYIYVYTKVYIIMYLLDNNIRERDESVRGATERLFEGRGSPATRQFQGKTRQPMSTI